MNRIAPSALREQNSHSVQTTVSSSSEFAASHLHFAELKPNTFPQRSALLTSPSAAACAQVALSLGE